jgi:Tol biopolymer transport system component
VERASESLCPSVALALLLILGTAVGARAATVELISKADPVPDSFGTSYLSGMSADGRYVLFQSTAPNLVPGQVDDNGLPDLFLRDRVAGTTTLISHQAGKPNVAGHAIPQPSISYFTLDASLSADGRYVAFASAWTDLVPGSVSNGAINIFLYDRVAGTTTLISHAAGDRAVYTDGLTFGARISADGNYVAFSSSGSNLVAGQKPSATGGPFNLFLYSRSLGSLALISHRAGAPATAGNGNTGISDSPAISADGGYIAFLSMATDLIPGQAGPSGEERSVFLYQRSNGAVSLVSHAAGSPLGFSNGDASEVQISADGRWIAFASSATDLISGQAQASTSAAFLYDRIAGATRLVSHGTTSPLTPEAADSLALSEDGRYLAFDSTAHDLIPGQVNLSGGGDVFVYDRVANSISLVSHSRDSATTTPSHSTSSGPSLSADGRFIAYRSSAVDLVSHQTDAVPFSLDIFVYDRMARTTTLASHIPTSLTTAATGGSSAARISADGSAVAFASDAPDLTAGRFDPNGFQDLFLFERTSAEVTDLSPTAPDVPAITPVGPSSAADISADGRFVVFISQANGLVPVQVDTSFRIDPSRATGTWDVFLRDRATGKTTLVSRSKSSPPTAAGGFSPAISADGNFVAFVGPDSQVEEGRPLYVYGRETDTLVLANHLPGSSGQPDGGPQNQPALSADGRYVAYHCSACHLVPGQQDGRPPGPSPGLNLDVFLYDRVTGLNTLVSHASDSATTTGDSPSTNPRISADGRFVVFSSAGHLAAGQPGGGIFVFDRTTGAVTLVNRGAGAISDGDAFDATISADGRWIAYRSRAVDLVPGQIDTNGFPDVFLYDQVTGATALVSHASSSPVTAGSADRNDYAGDFTLSLSGDGRWLAFTSQATDLVPGVTNPDELIAAYLYDRTSGQVALVSSAAGSPGTVSMAWQPVLSADGSRIAFLSSATDLVPGQSAQPAFNLFVQDRATGARTLAGRLSDLEYLPQGSLNNVEFTPRLSADGRVVTFTSELALVAGDFNRNWDAFVYDAATTTGPVTVPPCALFNGALRSNVRKPLTATGACGVPAGAQQVQIRLTVSRQTGKGNVRLFAGTATALFGILRFDRGANRSADFTVPLENGSFALLPFVAGNGTVRVSVEIDGYTP